MTYKTDMEAAFEEWFEARRQRTWRESRISTDPLEPHEAWSTDLRGMLREGWMGCVLWCRLCQKEHEGACVSSAEQKTEYPNYAMDRLWEIYRIATRSRVLPEDIDRIAKLAEGFGPIPACSICKQRHAEPEQDCPQLKRYAEGAILEIELPAWRCACGIWNLVLNLPCKCGRVRTESHE